MTEPIPLFRREAVEHQLDRTFADVLVIWPLPLKLFVIGAAAVAMLLVSYVWLGTYTRKAHVGGYLAPTKGLVKIIPREVGIVVERRVQEGQRVQVGDTLVVMSLEKTAPGAEPTTAALDELARRKAALEREKEKLRQIAAAQVAELRARVVDLDHEIASADEEARLQQARVDALGETLTRFEKLYQDKFVSATQLQAQRAVVLEQQVALANIRRSRMALARERGTTAKQLPEQELKSQNDVSAVDRQISALNQDLADAGARRQLIVTAPVAGTVTSVQAEVGQAVSPTYALMSILPEGSELEVRLLAPPSAVGFIGPGKEVKLRYAAYPYQRFGHYDATVRTVSRSIVAPGEIALPFQQSEPFYLVAADLRHQDVTAYGQHLPLRAGMTLDADILLDRRPLYEWILDPLLSVRGRL